MALYGMGIAIGDYDEDSDLDYYVTNIGANALLNNSGNGTFTDLTAVARVENTSTDTAYATSWGAAFLDYDNDTWLDLLVANAPYVPSQAVGTLPPEARLHEPLAALDGGAEGLDVLRRLIAGAPRWLAVGGRLLVEAREAQAPALAASVAAAGLTPRVTTDLELGATVVTGIRSSA